LARGERGRDGQGSHRVLKWLDGENGLKFLITGGAGFIGSHLAKYLVQKDHKVAILDNLSSGKIENLGDRKGIACYFGDCQNRFLLNAAAEGCDYVYHCASTVGVQKVLRDPASCIRNIISSTESVLSLGVPGMYFSTSEVYGKCYGPGFALNDEYAEDYPCVLSSAPRWSYAAAKLTGEWLALAEKWQVVRLFNVIGPNQNPAYGAVFPRFIQQAQEDRPLTIYGNGSQVRTFTAVSDVVTILDRLRGTNADIVNVGGAATISIRQLAIRIKKELHSKSVLDFVPYEKAYPAGFEECPSRVPDTTKLRSLIGNYEFRSLENMIKEVSHGKTVCQ